jgi:leucyl aminopeptidase
MFQSIKPASGGAAPKSSTPVIALFEKTTKLPDGFDALGKEAIAAVNEALARPDFSLTKGELRQVFSGKSRILVIGLGEKAKFDADFLRQGAAKALKAAWAGKFDALHTLLAPTLGDSFATSGSLFGRALADGLALANFEFITFKGTANKPIKKDEKPKPAPRTLAISAEKPLADGLSRGLTIAISTNITRTLAATPPNIAHPAYLVAYAKKLASQVGLKFSVIDAKKAESLGMGGLVAVGKAGLTPPALVILEHKPSSKKPSNKGPILLVGKAVTFDTGGYSIKPAEGMDRMKYDKCGGMTVIGTMHALASLKVDQHVIGLIPIAENMVSDKAYRPGDIITFYNGVTSEITNTDAEGRLILADALAYGTATYKPQAVIDLATLTGGVIVALGPYCAGCFCADPNLRGRLFDAGDFTSEKLWHLPLWDEHRQQIKGTHGDLVNSAGRDAHPIQGAAFLSYFVGPDGSEKLPSTPWAHLDIAGVSDVKTEKGIFAAGPTGYGVRLLTRMIETWS